MCSGSGPRPIMSPSDHSSCVPHASAAPITASSASACPGASPKTATTTPRTLVRQLDSHAWWLTTATEVQLTSVLHCAMSSGGRGRAAGGSQCPAAAATGPSSGTDIGSDPNEALAEILAAIEPRDRTRCLLDPIEDVLSIADLSLAHPALEFPHCLGKTLDMVEDEKPLDSCAFDEKMTLDPWSLGGRIPARDGRRAADDHSCSDIEAAHDRVA